MNLTALTLTRSLDRCKAERFAALNQASTPGHQDDGISADKATLQPTDAGKATTNQLPPFGYYS